MKVSLRSLGLLGLLYFTQGLPFGFQAIALPVYLRGEGVDLATLGFLGLLSAPWMLKALWAPAVDRFGWDRVGRRRSWILPMQGGLCLAALAGGVAASVGALGPLLALIFVMNLFAATQDIAVDGLAVDLLGPSELGPGNAAQVVGYKVGMLTGGGLLVWASQWIGWSGLFYAMGALVGATFLVVLFTPEPRGEGRGEERVRPALGEILSRVRRALKAPGAGWLVAVVLTYKMGESLVDTMFKPFLVDLGYAPAQIGAWVGTWGMLASLIGSAAGGLVAGWRPGVYSVALTGSLRVLGLVGIWGLTQVEVGAGAVIAATCLEHLLGGALTTALFALMMSQVDRRIGATHFTLLATLEVMGKLAASLPSGVLAEAIGYGGTFALGVLLSIAFLGLLIPLGRALDGPSLSGPVEGPLPQ